VASYVTLSWKLLRRDLVRIRTKRFPLSAGGITSLLNLISFIRFDLVRHALLSLPPPTPPLPWWKGGVEWIYVSAWGRKRALARCLRNVVRVVHDAPAHESCVSQSRIGQPWELEKGCGFIRARVLRCRQHATGKMADTGRRWCHPRFRARTSFRRRSIRGRPMEFPGLP